MSMSGLYNVGHDVGGFAGPRPEPELFVRWVQNGIFHPRFTIHSWNDDATVNEAWMYPEVTPHIRNAIKLRYNLLPYLYTLLYRAVTQDEPMLRPTFLDHDGDERTFLPTDDFFIGESLLVANVVEQSAQSRSVYLPENGVGYYEFWTGDYHHAGQEITVPVTLASIPLFVKAGTVLPLSPGVNRSGNVAGQERILVVYPLPKGMTGETISQLYEDDGDNKDALDGNHQFTELKLLSQDDRLCLSWSRSGHFDPKLAGCRICLVNGDDRPVMLHGNKIELNALMPF